MTEFEKSASMDLLHDLSSRFRGERYTIEIDISPEWVKIKKVS